MNSLPLPVFPQRSFIAWIVGLSLISGLGAAALFLAHWKVDDNVTGYYVPRGYRTSVVEMLSTNALRYDLPMSGSRWGAIRFDDSTASSKEQQFFRQSRRLQQDIDQFNEEGSGFFEVRLNGAIGITRDYHNFSLPYPRREPWGGSFSLGGEVLPAIVSPDLYLGFSDKDSDGAPLQASDFGLLSIGEWTAPTDKNYSRRSPAYTLHDAASQPFLRFAMQDGRVFMALITSDTTAVYLNGEVVNRQGSAAAITFLARRDSKSPADPNVAPLQIGDRLRLRSLKDGRQVILRFGQYAGGIVSRKWMEDGRSISVVDPELSADLPYLSSLHDAMNRFVRHYPESGGLKQPDVRLTFDKTLHKSVNRIFLDGVRQFDARRSPVPRIEREPACVTIINALNGDVLAIPSYPAPEDIARFQQQAINDRASAVPAGRLRRLGLNQNLTLIPIGSTTKPLLASAIWETYPELSKLVIDEPADSRRDVLGYRFTSPYATLERRHLDYKGFLRMSSNDYTIHLGMLILAGGDASFNAAGQPILSNGGILDLSRYLKGDRIPAGLLGLPVFPKLAETYDIALQSKFSEDTGTNWDPGILEGFLRQAGVDPAVFSPVLPDDPAARARITGLRDALFNSFSNTLPEATNLHLDKIATVRGHYVSMLLGSGFNYWSNVKLAEAYARLGTGRKIRARIALDPKKTTTLNDFEELPLSDDTLKKVHAGMAEAADGLENSTALRISDSLKKAKESYARQGLTFSAICKTGTAGRMPARMDKSGRLLEPKRECSAFCLYLEVSDPSGIPLAALSTSTYLQDRAATKGDSAPRNSAVAVQLTKDFLPELLSWLDRQPGVKRK